jgi:hypothetical protein
MPTCRYSSSYFFSALLLYLQHNFSHILIREVIEKCAQDLKGCDYGILIQLLNFWTLSIVLYLFKNMSLDNVQKINNCAYILYCLLI